MRFAFWAIWFRKGVMFVTIEWMLTTAAAESMIVKFNGRDFGLMCFH